jgi:Fe-S-cluster-containing hydrogenase component 2
MPDTRTIAQIETEGYPWIGCECCRGMVWVPFKMIRQKIPALGAMTLDELGAPMKCEHCGSRPSWRSHLTRFSIEPLD